MKNRVEIKQIAKDAFYRNYWLCVGVNVVVSILIGVVSSITFGIGALILTPSLLIGLNVFSLALYNGGEASFDTVFSQGFDNFGRKLGGFLWMMLFISGRCCSSSRAL